MRAAEQGMNPVSHNDPNFFLVKTPKQVVTEWAAAFNQSDAAAAAALYHEDATNIRVPFGEPLRGRRAMLENFIEFFRAFPDSYTRVESIFEDGDWAIMPHFHIAWMWILPNRGLQDSFSARLLGPSNRVQPAWIAG
jgi:hypothetical protein